MEATEKTSIENFVKIFTELKSPTGLKPLPKPSEDLKREDAYFRLCRFIEWAFECLQVPKIIEFGYPFPEKNVEDLHFFMRCLEILENYLEENSGKDILGQVFGQLNMLDKKHLGQCHTPSSIATLTSNLGLTLDFLKERLKSPEPYTILEPACGTGALTIASWHFLKNALNEDALRNLEFYCTDISRISFKACFVQLSLLGCPAVVIYGDCLKDDIWDARETIAFWMNRHALL